ncbi:MAG: zinc ribbon domain-containing protein, partial [Candidatus Lokiarchaeota archaeon]|nr:zinc ribbon domain-containing protein [Candidatus Lokiarchaeota archaeon]
LFPLFAGLCTVIAILAPTAHFGYSGITWDWWMWDLVTMGVSGYPPISAFISDTDFVIPSIVSTSALLLSIVNLFILSGSTKKRNLDTKEFIVMSVVSAVLTIGIVIYYMVSVDIAFYDGMTVEGEIFPAGYHFWEAFDVGLGIILSFISAIVSFIGVGVFRYYSNQKLFRVSPNTDVATRYVSTKTDVATKYIPVSTPMGVRNYCPECGHKNLRTDAKFCTKCGFQL